MTTWVDACSINDIEEEGAIRFDAGGATFAIYRTLTNEYFCTSGLCTHEDVHLASGLVLGNTVECPKHASIFDFTTGEVATPPACLDLATYPTKVENERVLVQI